MDAHHSETLEIRNLKALTDSELSALSSLDISEWQEVKGGSFSESIEAWQRGEIEQILGLCFVLDSRLIGMTLFKRPPLSPAWACSDSATIHGLKISTAWQRQGFGHKAFELAIQKLKEQWPNVNKLMLAVDADNDPAIAIYRGYGMIEREFVKNGPNGPEYRFETTFLSKSIELEKL